MAVRVTINQCKGVATSSWNWKRVYEDAMLMEEPTEQEDFQMSMRQQEPGTGRSYTYFTITACRQRYCRYIGYERSHCKTRLARGKC